MAFEFDMYGLSHTGHVRTRNEDTLLLDPDAGLAVIADGMGGHPGGADASALAVRLFVDEFLREDVIHSSLAWGETMARSVAAAHAGVRKAVQADPALEGMGTTLTAAALTPDGRLIVAHVGDSRGYRLRAGNLTRLTRDHTWVAEAIEQGILSTRAAADHPMAHVITQAVGIEYAPAPDIEAHALEAGDLLLLCSDGLTGPVPDDAIRATLLSALAHGRLDDAPRRLIAAALANGGPDNVTVAVVQVRRSADATESEETPISPAA